MQCHFAIAAIVLTLLSMQAHAADWKACERAKLRQISLEQRAHGTSGKNVRGKKTGTRESAAQLDDWLWKNCRSYASELRSLEQSRL